MIAVLSPAKNMVSASESSLIPGSPRFLKEAEQLCKQLKRYSLWELESLLKVNPQLAMKAYTDYHSFRTDLPGHPAILSYRGLAYQHLSPEDFTPEDFRFADSHLRILSAFYGLLLPTDGILPYRMEFLCGFKPDGKSLYAFWKGKVYQELTKAKEPIINLASAEYSRLILPYRTGSDHMITCDFLVNRHGKYRTLATEAKMGRGEMARYLVKNRLTEPEELKSFAWNSYRYNAALSTPERFAFLKSE